MSPTSQKPSWEPGSCWAGCWPGDITPATGFCREQWADCIHSVSSKPMTNVSMCHGGVVTPPHFLAHFEVGLSLQQLSQSLLRAHFVKQNQPTIAGFAAESSAKSWWDRNKSQLCSTNSESEKTAAGERESCLMAAAHPRLSSCLPSYRSRRHPTSVLGLAHYWLRHLPLLLATSLFSRLRRLLSVSVSWGQSTARAFAVLESSAILTGFPSLIFLVGWSRVGFLNLIFSIFLFFFFFFLMKRLSSPCSLQGEC